MTRLHLPQIILVVRALGKDLWIALCQVILAFAYLQPWCDAVVALSLIRRGAVTYSHQVLYAVLTNYRLRLPLDPSCMLVACVFTFMLCRSPRNWKKRVNDAVRALSRLPP